MMIARTRTSLRKFLGDRRGSPALEFALVAPLFFAGVFGAMELGRGLYERNQFAAAASFATREIAKDPSLTAAQLKTLIESELGYNPGELTRFQPRGCRAGIQGNQHQLPVQFSGENRA